MCDKVKKAVYLAIVLSITLTFGANYSQASQTNIATDDLFALSLEELMDVEVASGGFFKTNKNKVPGSVMIYDMDEINDTSVRTLADLIELYVPGSVIGSHERQGKLIGTRGLLIDNNAKTLIMRDNQQINLRSHFGYMIGLEAPFLGDISKVEVIHGPGAILHGSGAINGFINLVPKTGESHPGVFANYEYGFAETSNLFEGGYGFSYGENRNLFVYGGSYSAEGFEPDEDYGSTKAYAGDIDAFGFKRSNYKFSSTWNHDNFNLNFFVEDMNPQKNEVTESGYFKNELLGIRPKYTIDLTDEESIELTGSFLLMDFADTGANGYMDIQGGSEEHLEFKSIFKTTRFDRHSLAAGFLVGRKTFRDSDFYFSADPDQGIESINTRWNEYGIFIEDVIELNDQWTMSLGARYDKYRTGDYSGGQLPQTYTPEEIAGHVSPRVAICFEMDPKTTIKASYQHGFRMPDAAYYDWNLLNNGAASNLGYSNSPGLEPEEMESFEFNVHRVFNKKLTMQLNSYYNIFKDQLKWDELTTYWTPAEVAAINGQTGVSGWPGGMFQNSFGNFEIYGLETVAEYKLSDRTKLAGSYGFAKVNNYDVEQRYPTHQVKAMLSHELIENKLKMNLNYLYQSRYTHEHEPIIDERYENARNIFDLAMVYQVNKNFRIKGVAKNIFGDETPPLEFRMDQPHRGNMGADETRFYITAELKF